MIFLQPTNTALNVVKQAICLSPVTTVTQSNASPVEDWATNQKLVTITNRKMAKLRGPKITILRFCHVAVMWV